MRLYLDDDSVHRLLLRLLRNDGHDVQMPTDAGMVGASDAVQLTHAVKTGRVLLSRNHQDFNELHDLVSETGGSHNGILIVRRENNRPRDMTQHQIVRALTKLVASGTPIENQVTVLNHWR
jgi:hypothetical protein